MAFSKKEKIKIVGDWIMLVFSILILLSSAGFFLYTKYPSSFESISQIEKREEILPEEKIIIEFSKPIIAKYFGFGIKINPESQFDYYFENKNRRLVIVPKKNWVIGNEYQIDISGRNIFLSPIKKSIYFRTISYPELKELYPEYGAKDVLLDIEDPIRAVFDKSINNFKIKFIINPFKELDYEFDESGNQINLMPREELERGKKYYIEVYIKYKDEDNSKYKKIRETFFETKPLPPSDWDKDFGVRLDQAKRFTEARIKEGRYIDINLKSQVLSIFENGKILDAFMISTGKRGMETKQGTFAIANKTTRAWSKKYGLFMPFWMALVKSGEFGIHELPEWPGGYKEGTNHLGTPVSHGCVRLGVGSAETVYNFAEVGTPVVIHS